MNGSLRIQLHMHIILEDESHIRLRSVKETIGKSRNKAAVVGSMICP